MSLIYRSLRKHPSTASGDQLTWAEQNSHCEFLADIENLFPVPP